MRPIIGKKYTGYDIKNNKLDFRVLDVINGDGGNEYYVFIKAEYKDTDERLAEMLNLERFISGFFGEFFYQESSENSQWGQFEKVFEREDTLTQ